MPSFFFALIACFLAATGGRDQRLMAQLSTRLGASNALLATGWAVSAATAALAAYAGAGLAQLMPPAGKTMFVALALLFAAIELAWPVAVREPEEPTRSLFAIALVIASRQLSDGARFLVVAIAAATGAPHFAAIGGAIGGGAAIALGWALGEVFVRRLPVRAIRLVIGGGLLLVAAWAGLAARGIL